MNSVAPILATARTDEADRLTASEEPISSLQMRCAGTVDGTVAVPELLEVIQLARTSGTALIREIHAYDGSSHIRAWVEVVPAGAGQGCDVFLKSWRSGDEPAGEGQTDAGPSAARRRVMTDRTVAELTALLDAQQRVLVAHSNSPDLADTQVALAKCVGKRWTEVLKPLGLDGDNLLHWRLLDGVEVVLAHSRRRWRVSLIPQSQAGADPTGFELLLHSDSPAEPQETPSGNGQPDLGMQPLSGGVVAHDLAPALRQPVSRIIANAETVRTRLAGPIPDAYAEYAGEIVSAGRLLSGLIDDFSDLEAVEDAGFSLDIETLDLVQAARQAAGILNVRALERQMDMAVLPALDELEVQGEFRRVLQILLNLIGNAIRYAPQGSPLRIEIAREGDRGYVDVIDQGPGLDAHEQARVFERFERLGRSGDGGSGLGLYISRRLARAMNGDVTVRSEKGQGATFTLTLPCRE